MKCLITAGPTREFFDPVRYISNPSSGKMGFAIARAAVAAGWTVDLVHGPVAIPVPESVNAHPVVTGEEMFATCKPLFEKCDMLIMCAAVCDMRPRHFSGHKIKKDAINWRVEFEPTRDILKTLSGQRRDGQILVGFAAETDQLEQYARKKLEEKSLDWIVANSVASGGAFESDGNTITLIGKNGVQHTFGPADKQTVANWLVQQLLTS